MNIKRFAIVFAVIFSLGTLGLTPTKQKKKEAEPTAIQETKSPAAREAEPASLREAMKDKDVEIRKAAALALGNIKDPAAVPPLIEALEDNDPQVRKYAAEALEKIGDVRAGPYLMAYYKDWESLSKMGNKAVPILIKVLKKGEPYDRLQAAQALGKIKDKSAVPPLTNALTDSERMVRYAAIISLIEIGEKSSASDLVKALKDVGATLQLRIIDFVAENGDQRQVPEVLKSADQLKIDREILIDALAQMDLKGMEPGSALAQALAHGESYSYAYDGLIRAGKPVVPVLMGVVEKSENLNQRIGALKVLKEIGDPKSVPVLKKVFTKGQTDKERDIAAQALNKIAPAEFRLSLLVYHRKWDELVAEGRAAVPFVGGALKDRDPEVRMEAVRALGKINHPTTIDFIVSSADDENARVRREACIALGNNPSPQATSALLKVIKDDNNPDVRWEALNALSKSRDKGLSSIVVHTISDRDPRVRALSAKILGDINDPETVPILIRALYEERTLEVKLEITNALGKTKDSRATAALLDTLKKGLTSMPMPSRYYEAEKISEPTAKGPSVAYGESIESRTSACEAFEGGRKGDKNILREFIGKKVKWTGTLKSIRPRRMDENFQYWIFLGKEGVKACYFLAAVPMSIEIGFRNGDYNFWGSIKEYEWIQDIEGGSWIPVLEAVEVVRAVE